MNSSMIQRQLKLNARTLRYMYDQKRLHCGYRKHYNDKADEVVTQDVYNPYREQAAIYTPFINKLSKRIKALEQLQKALKKSLQEAYWQEHFAKTYEPLPDDEDDFLWLEAARVAAEEGFVGPTVVLEIEGLR